MGVQRMTDDLDMAGHHIVDWRYLEDLPSGGATTGQALVWNGTSWAPGTVTSGGGTGLVDSVFGRTGDVLAAAGDYTVDQISDAEATAAVDWANTTITLAGLTLKYSGDDYITLSFVDADDNLLAYFRYSYPDDWLEVSPMLKGTSFWATGSMITDTIAESTTDAGVTIDGLLVKDGLIAWDGVDKTGSSLADLATKSHTVLSDIGTNTHAQIDTHVASTSNPHSVTADQVLPSQTSNSGKVLKTNATTASWVLLDAAIEIAFDGGGATLTVDSKGDYTVPYDMTITGWDLLADQSGSVEIGVWKDSYANYPPTIADVLLSPSITTATKNQASSLSHALTKGDILRFNVNSVTTIQRVTLALKGTRSA